MKKFLISACLVGQHVRYDGKHSLNEKIQDLIASHHVIIVCPEIAGGLTTPRLPAEIIGGDGHDVLAGKARVINTAGKDVTSAFIQGAELTLSLAKKHQVTHVILKANSPSCGSQQIYDGTFQGQKRTGQGVTTALLQQHGFEVIDESQFQQYCIKESSQSSV